MPFAIKAEVPDPHAETFVFRDQKTMYGGKCIAAGDEVFIFASEHAGGAGLVAAGVVAEANSVARTAGVARQTPRVSVTVYRTRSATRPLGRRELKPFADWSDAGPETELNFKFYRQVTNKVAGISATAAAFLRECCDTVAASALERIVGADVGAHRPSDVKAPTLRPRS